MKDLKEALKEWEPSDRALELIAKELGIEPEWPQDGDTAHIVQADGFVRVLTYNASSEPLVKTALRQGNAFRDAKEAERELDKRAAIVRVNKAIEKANEERYLHELYGEAHTIALDRDRNLLLAVTLLPCQAGWGLILKPCSSEVAANDVISTHKDDLMRILGGK